MPLNHVTAEHTKTQTPNRTTVQSEPLGNADLTLGQTTVLHAQRTIGNAAVRRMLANNVQRDSNVAEGRIADIATEAPTWTVPGGVGSTLQTAHSNAVEAEAHASQLVGATEMVQAGWGALEGSQISDTPPDLITSGRQVRSEITAAHKSLDSATKSTDTARAQLVTAREQTANYVP